MSRQGPDKQDSAFTKGCRAPRLLQWVTGNIGIHHVHHVRPGIPNYRLQECYDSVPELQAIKPLTLLKSLGALRLNLYDENLRELVSFRSLKRG
jgi:omega-6 fatty acid desaturase (delta-12 desaturase)